MTPIVSIIIPCYNQGIFLQEALESVSRYKDKAVYEIIIVNDGSTDTETLAILKQLAAKGLHIVNQRNKGLGAARNAAIKAATGKYILPLDCDNKIKPEYISESIVLMDNDKNIDVVYGNAEYFGERTGTWETGEFNLQRLMIQNYIDACAVFRKSIMEKIGGYDENMPVMGHEDWDFWLRIAFQNGKFHYVNKVLFEYRYSGKSMVHTIPKDKLLLVLNYMEKKHSSYLNRAYLNNTIFFRLSQHKGLALYLLFKTYFPRVSNLFRKAGIVKSKNII